MIDDTQALERLLWQAAEEHAEKAGFGFSEGSAHALRELIGQGVETLKSEGVASDTGPVERARTNVVRFTSAMIAEATAREYDELREDTVSAAYASLCPIWPIC